MRDLESQSNQRQVAETPENRIKSQLLYRLSYGLATGPQDKPPACNTSITDDDARCPCKVNIAVPIRGPHAKRPDREILARR